MNNFFIFFSLNAQRVLFLSFFVVIGMLKAQNKNDSVPQKNHSKNIVSISPLQAMDVGFGWGATYERKISKDGKVALTFPFSLLLSDRYYGDNYSVNYYFTPGLKFYPGKLQKTTSYAIGPALMFGYLGPQFYGWYDWGPSPSFDHSFRFGILINNYVNFQVTKHFSFGINGGFGLRYLEIRFFQNGNNYQTLLPFSITGQATFNLSYRF